MPRTYDPMNYEATLDELQWYVGSIEKTKDSIRITNRATVTRYENTEEWDDGSHSFIYKPIHHIHEVSAFFQFDDEGSMTKYEFNGYESGASSAGGLSLNRMLSLLNWICLFRQHQFKNGMTEKHFCEIMQEYDVFVDSIGMWSTSRKAGRHPFMSYGVSTEDGVYLHTICGTDMKKPEKSVRLDYDICTDDDLRKACETIGFKRKSWKSAENIIDSSDVLVHYSNGTTERMSGTKYFKLYGLKPEKEIGSDGLVGSGIYGSYGEQLMLC